MPNLGEAIGLALTGGDIDREGARLEGLNLGSQINARKATTVNALAQARLRVDEAEARETLADNLDLGGNKALAATIRARGNPKQVTDAQLGQQEFGFRESIADLALPFEQRQASAQAVEGKVVDPFQFGPGGTLAADVFNPGEAPFLTETGPASIDADVALAEDRRASAALDDEKRLHPERFKRSTTINVGGQGLGDAILSDLGESTIPLDIEPTKATGPLGFGASVANSIFDVVDANLPFPDTEKAQNAMQDLMTRTQIVGQQAVPGRPSNYLLQQMAAFGVNPNDPFRGDQRSLSRMSQTSSFLGGEVDRLRRILNAGRLTPSKIADHEDALRNLAGLKQDYDVIIARFQAKESGAAPAAQVTPGAVPAGWTITKKAP